MSKLSAVKVRNAKPKNKPYKIADGKGLYFHIAPSGKKTWRYRYEFLGKETIFTLGEYPLMSLEQARKERMEAREMVKSGINPTEERRAAKKRIIKKQEAARKIIENSFESVALEWVKQQKGGWSKEHANAVLASLRADAFPILGEHLIDEIDPPLVLRVIRAIESRGALEIAKKVLQRIIAVFRYAVQTGKTTFNPATEMKGVIKARKVTHMAALKQGDLHEFLNKLSYSDLHITTKLALEFTILTAARTGETRGATWDEIDFENSLWRISEARMKMQTPHKVPLSHQAIAILDRVGILFGQSGFVFPGIRQQAKQLSENTLLYAMYRLGYHSKATVHGFRATFSTIANEAGFNPDVIEKALAHQERNKVRAAYHRSEYLEQRKKLLQWWADFLDHTKAGAEIIPFKQGGIQ